MNFKNLIVALLFVGAIACTSTGKKAEEEKPQSEFDKVCQKFSNSTGAEKDSAFVALLEWKSSNIQESWFIIDYFIEAANFDGGKYHKEAYNAAMKEIETSPFFNNHFYHYKRVMPIAKTTEQKAAIIEKIGSYHTYMAIVFLNDYISDEELKEVTANSVLKITIPELGGRAGFTGSLVRSLMDKVKTVEEVASVGDNKQYINDFLNNLPEEKVYVAPAPEEGFVSLFNSENLDGWFGDTAAYVVENGLIVVNPLAAEGEGRISTEKEYGDFVFRFEFQLTPAANNGVGIRNGLEGDPAYQAMESQILDNDYEGYAKLGKAQFHGSVYGVIAAEKGVLKPMGEWNTEEIMIKGKDVKITLNGKVIVEGNLDEAVADKPKVAKAHPGIQRTSGHISFLGHGDVVRFRNIRVKELNEK